MVKLQLLLAERESILLDPHGKKSTFVAVDGCFLINDNLLEMRQT